MAGAGESQVASIAFDNDNNYDDDDDDESDGNTGGESLSSSSLSFAGQSQQQRSESVGNTDSNLRIDSEVEEEEDEDFSAVVSASPSSSSFCCGLDSAAVESTPYSNNKNYSNQSRENYNDSGRGRPKGGAYADAALAAAVSGIESDLLAKLTLGSATCDDENDDDDDDDSKGAESSPTPLALLGVTSTSDGNGSGHKQQGSNLEVDDDKDDEEEEDSVNSRGGKKTIDTGAEKSRINRVIETEEAVEEDPLSLSEGIDCNLLLPLECDDIINYNEIDDEEFIAVLQSFNGNQNVFDSDDRDNNNNNNNNDEKEKQADVFGDTAKTNEAILYTKERQQQQQQQQREGGEERIVENFHYGQEERNVSIFDWEGELFQTEEEEEQEGEGGGEGWWKQRETYHNDEQQLYQQQSLLSPDEFDSVFDDNYDVNEEKVDQQVPQQQQQRQSQSSSSTTSFLVGNEEIGGDFDPTYLALLEEDLAKLHLRQTNYHLPQASGSGVELSYNSTETLLSYCQPCAEEYRRYDSSVTSNTTAEHCGKYELPSSPSSSSLLQTSAIPTKDKNITSNCLPRYCDLVPIAEEQEQESGRVANENSDRLFQYTKTNSNSDNSRKDCGYILKGNSGDIASTPEEEEEEGDESSFLETLEAGDLDALLKFSLLTMSEEEVMAAEEEEEGRGHTSLFIRNDDDDVAVGNHDRAVSYDNGDSNGTDGDDAEMVCDHEEGNDYQDATMLEPHHQQQELTFHDEEEQQQPQPGEDEETEEEENHHPRLIVSMRDEALQTASLFTASFGTEIYPTTTRCGSRQEPTQTPKNERSCLGHRETVFGLSFSECGRYVATAGQDSTIRVWDVAKNVLSETLMGHDRDYECLRVAWASSKWGKRQLQRNGGQGETSSMVLASGGANGVVKLWTGHSNSRDENRKKHVWKCVLTLDHCKIGDRQEHGNNDRDAKSKEDNDEDEDEEGEEERNVPQVYALQFIDHWQGFGGNPIGTFDSESQALLMTSSDDYIHLWELLSNDRLESENRDGLEIVKGDETHLKEVMTIRFTGIDKGCGGVFLRKVATSSSFDCLHNETTGGAANHAVTSETTSRKFGGSRNPENLVFVFDASHCPANNLLGVALSDGTLRLVNGHGVCVSILELPGCNSHLTSFAWDVSGSRLASCVATGHLILWGIDDGDGRGRVRPSCVAVLEGGHEPGRPLFGARYCGGENEELIVSWGVDGRLCLWDSRSAGQIHAPISTLVNRADYPIYAVDVFEQSRLRQMAICKDPQEKEESVRRTCIAVGGGRDGGFLGIPVYLYDISAASDAARGNKETTRLHSM